MFDLHNKVVLITGAGGGLGRAFAQAFAGAGTHVVAADRNEAGAAETAQLIGGLAVGVDVTNEASLQQMVQTVLDNYGKIDVLVNNAAIYATITRKPFYELTEAEWDGVMSVNLKGVWLCSKVVVQAMIERAKTENVGARIINIASATVMSGSPNWSHYVASKGGVIGLTRSMAKELGRFNITVNAIAPGFTLTEASLNLMDNAQQYGVDRGAIKRPSTADDITGTALYLASPLADFVTGQTIIVDGGKQFI